MKDLIFKVEKVPVKDIGLKYPALSGISHAVVGGNKVLNFCSEDYNLIPNQTIVESFDEFWKDSGIKTEFFYRSYGGTRFKMNYYFPDFKSDMGGRKVGDDIGPSMYIWNSYDGSLKFQFGLQVMRLVCLNGLTTPVDITHMKMSHTMGSMDAVPKALELVEEYFEIFNDITEPYEDLKFFKVKNIPSRIEQTIENTSYPVWLKDLVTERALFEHRELNAFPTDWLIYNAMNWGLNHHADNLLGRRSDKIDREVLSYLLEA